MMTTTGGSSPASNPTSFDVEAARADFPVFQKKVHGSKPIIYLDSGASAQKPRAVIDTMVQMMEGEYANVHRGTYWLSERATVRYEQARETVRRFVNAARPEEIVFTMGATDAINLVAQTHGRAHLGPGDAVLITEMEHHSNIVPWQMLRDEKGVTLKVCPITDEGALDLEAFDRLMTPEVKLVAFTQTSNVLGTVPPARRLIDRAHAQGALVLMDGCQGVVHGGVDVQALDVDFYVFSGHKLYGPTGIGVLYARHALLEAMPPWRGGGDMIASVSFERSEWAAPPAKFEAGTPNIVQAIGLAAAIDYVTGLGQAAIAAHEADLLTYAVQALSSVPGLRLYGTAPGKVAVISFTLDCAHPHDMATVLDQSGVCIRVGHHCAQPLMGRLGVSATARASLGLYNTRADIDALVRGLETVRSFFA
ncbi:aminotransferase class V-fold PLP-dependent enzyme [Pararhodospirillum oryzae]|uniref:Cysteine desulfurase n=1 Tax=Pararhodospirillum oryzae TaxID=478448 RepID=A0A512H4P0_9PROT|nr:cysteine desulfurase [Pararhodospirillum oryzae]GEO80426.1 cysteine desulfurase [Pararhodospirillum oryzae]